MRPYIITTLAALAMGMAYMLSHSEMLMLAEYTNPVAMSPETMADLMQQPMGLLAWAGCWLTQLCHIPALGAMALSALWAATAAMLVKCWRLNSGSCWLALLPPISLIWSIACLGYWMHYSCLTGYCFSHTLAVIAIAATLMASRHCKPIAMLSPWILYPALGFWTLPLGLATAAMQFRDTKISALIPIASSAIAPIAWQSLCYSKYLTAAGAYSAGLPTLIINETSGAHLLIPLYACAMLMAAAIIIKELTIARLLAPALAAALATAALATSQHSQFFYTEIRMQRAAVEGNWQQIIEMGDSAQEHTETMKVFYEAAMAQTRTLGSHAFATRHTQVTNPESHSIKVNAMQMAAPIIHYYYGRYNISTRWCVEVGVKYGFGTGLLRMLAMSAKASGEKQAASKYREIIRKSLFFGQWEIPEPSQATRDFSHGIYDRLETDHDCDEYLQYIATLPGNIHTQTAAEQAMYYAMRSRNKAAFRSIIQKDSILARPLQRHFQEACAMMLDTIPQGIVSPQVAADMQAFNRETQRLRETQDKSLIEPIRQKYGQTYWWYVLFEK